MATRQRSFFDQKPSTYKNRPWPSRPPYANRPPANYSEPAQPPAPRAAIAASSQARRKLGTFRYEADSEQMLRRNARDGQKENMAVPPKRTGDFKQAAEVADERMHSSPVNSRDRLHDFPQTPVPRVPFADLVDNGTLLRTNSSPTRTPPVHVGWKQSPTSSDSESAWKEYRNRKKRKRPRSSSPDQLSSQRSLHIDKAFLMPVAGVSGAVDPANELEKRLFGERNGMSLGLGIVATPCKGKVTSSASAELMRSSSPTTPGMALTESAKLRRTRSCGVTFPTSATRKRRRVELSVRSDDGAEPAFDPRLARMSALLDIVDGGLLGRDKGQSGSQREVYQSSTDTHRRISHGVQDEDETVLPLALINSSLEARHVCGQPPASEEDALDRQDPNCLSQTVASLHIKKSSSSEFGGDDFDEDFFETALTGESPSLKQPLQNHSKDSFKKQDGAARMRAPKGLQATLTPTLLEEDDDNEFMNEVCVADLEQLAATYDHDTPISTNTKGHARSDTLAQDRTANPSKLHGPKQKLHPNEQAQLLAAIDVSSDEEFGDDDFENIAEEFGALTQSAEQKVSSSSKSGLIPRYVVKEVLGGSYTAPNGFTRGEKIIHVQEERSGSPKLIHLREAWLDSSCPVGVTVHVIGEFTPQGSLVVDNAQNLLVVHPDQLLSATVVADAFKCSRRAVLQDRVKATNEVNESQVFGHILHEVFQESLKANRWDSEWLENTTRSVSARFLESLFELSLPVERAVQEMMNKLQDIQRWANLFVSSSARPGAQLKGPQDTVQAVGINKLLDVEEHVWSPLYGLKGNVDATVQIHAPVDSQQDRQLTVPFELKTGRATNNTSHNSQTALYTLLLSDRYDIQIAFGILYYMETSNMIQILGQRKDIIHMIMKRNELALYIRNRNELPPMLKNEFSCSRCYAQSSCFVYHKLAEDGDGKTSGMGAKFKELMGHLNPIHAEFFKKWNNLLTKEEGDVLRFRGELWSMLSSEREKVGRCFSAVTIKPGSAVENSDAPKINRFEYIFVKRKPSKTFSFTESQINLGEPIVISDEAGHFALANGYVTKIRRHEISVAVDRRLHNSRLRQAGFHEKRNQSFKGVMEVKIEYETSGTSNTAEPDEPVVYRLDKDEFSNGMALVRNNLIRIMEKDLFGARPLRRLIIEDVAPSFRPLAESESIPGSQCELNVDQRNAIAKVMSANEYALVLGMPGTGKTTTISHIIRALVAKGKSILLTSYTHTAVDNILLKIKDEGMSILRIGAESKIHPEVESFANLACRPKQSFEEIQTSYQSQIVATTCLGINHPIFNQRTFDYCIVDEASQITLPVCLGPIRMAHRFVLVGDHYQLPPLVQNKEAQEGGLDISLFKLLSDKHPESVVNLEHQYRMCADIMSLSNTLIYNGMLKCGNSAVAQRRLEIPDLTPLKQHHHTLASLASLGSSQQAPCLGVDQPTCMLRKAMDPSSRVIFLNTDTVGDAAKEIVAGSRITNPFEVSMATQLVRSLAALGINPSDIGVITLYRSQLALLRQSLKPHSSTHLPQEPLAGLEMHTADKFQGRDKEAIVLSLVRSNDRNIVGDLLQDWRRVNVALTRARTKLVIVGSRSTMKNGNDLLKKMCDMIDQNGWRVDVPPRALDEHCFTDLVSQSLEASGRGSKPSSPAKANSVNSPLSAVKRGKGMSAERILKSRPVLQDIVNGAIG